MNTAFEYSPSDGTDGALDEAEGSRLSSAQVPTNKPRKKRVLRTSRKKQHADSIAPPAGVVPRNLSADAVRSTTH